MFFGHLSPINEQLKNPLFFLEEFQNFSFCVSEKWLWFLLLSNAMPPVTTVRVSQGGILPERDHSFGKTSLILRVPPNHIRQLRYKVKRNCSDTSVPSAERVVTLCSSNGSDIVPSEALENDQKLLLLKSDASVAIHAGNPFPST